MRQRAPNFYDKQILSAELHMNALIASVNSAYGSMHAPQAALYGNRGYYYHDSLLNMYVYSTTRVRHHAESGRLMVTLLVDQTSGDTPEDDLVVQINFSYSVNLVEVVNEGVFRHLTYDNDPSSLLSGEEFIVRIYSNSNLDSQCIVFQPYEENGLRPIIQLDDFLGGAPPLTEWQALTNAANALLDTEYQTNAAFLSTLWQGVVDHDYSITYKNVKNSRYGFFNYQIRWPEIIPHDDGSEPHVGSNYDTACDIEGVRIFHHGQYLTKTQSLDPIVCYDKMWAQVGDRCQLNSKEGTITHISGDADFTIDWGGNPPTQVQHMDKLKVWTNWDRVDYVNVRPTEDEGQYQQFNNYNFLIDFTPLSLPVGKTYPIQFYSDSSTPSGFDPRDGTLLVGYLAETVNMITGQPEPGWLKMDEWTHLDSVPGAGDHAINNIVENIRLLQQLNIHNNGVTRLRDAVTSHFDLCLNHKYRWLAIIVRKDLNGDLPEPKIIYHDGNEWITESLSYDEELSVEEGFEYIDLTDFPLLIQGSFYTLKNVHYAYELDFVAEQ